MKYVDRPFSLLMCSDAEDLRAKAGWDGASGNSRRRLLSHLQRMNILFPFCLVHTEAACRLYPVIYDDPPKADVDLINASTSLPAATLRVSQSIRCFGFTLHGPRLLACSLSPDYDNDPRWSHERGVELALESFWTLFGYWRTGSACIGMEDWGSCYLLSHSNCVSLSG
jgi:hypothetical protein